MREAGSKVICRPDREARAKYPSTLGAGTQQAIGEGSGVRRQKSEIRNQKSGITTYISLSSPNWYCILAVIIVK